jgi:hypothetical protein
VNAIKGTYRNGQILLEAPADWPEGITVLVEPLPGQPLPEAAEEDSPPDAAEIARQLALMDRIEPLIMTPEEEARWEEARRTQQEFEKSIFNEHAEQLRRMWE